MESNPHCALLILVAAIRHELTATGIEGYKRSPFNAAHRSIAVINSKSGLLRRSAGVLVGVAFLTIAGVSLATEQSKDRQAGRDVNQDAKQEARKAKVDCRAADQQSNSECRQDKRDTKQEGREDKRETKRK
jgi:hypothetical protein